MLTMNVTYHCNPGQRESFYQALCKLGARDYSLNETGNHKYDYYFSAEDPDDLLLVETWTDQATLEAHWDTPSFEKLQGLKAQYCRSVDIDRFDF